MLFAHSKNIYRLYLQFIIRTNILSYRFFIVIFQTVILRRLEENVDRKLIYSFLAKSIYTTVVFKRKGFL